MPWMTVLQNVAFAVKSKKPSEPFGALDALMCSVIQDEFLKIRKETNQTV
ncbi:hypothetical protein [Polynucleobacter necessarius]